MVLLKSATDEIFNKMAEKLGIKIEAGEAAENFKRELENTKTKDDVDKLMVKYKRSLRMDPSQEDWEALANKRKSQLPDTQYVLDQPTINQAIDHLISAADLFDNSGLKITANVIDKIIKNFAK